jgi:glycosyltransferase involved in cell wall biosynthesis
MDAATPLVSVIMSVHNGEQWLKEAIDSIVHQTYGNWEFIIIDDASNKATQNILRSYTDSRIKVFREDVQQGLTKNLNTAINLCKGEFIARMDGDDISLPERFQQQIDYLLKHKETDVVAGFINMIEKSGKYLGTWKDDRRANTWPKIKKMLPWKSCIAHPPAMFRAGVLRQYRYDEKQRHSQDWDLWLRLATDNRRIEKIQEPVLQYRVHDRSITATSNKKSAFLKKHEFYKIYFTTKRKGWFNFKVRLGYIFNRCKLFLSCIKRRFIS